MIALYITLGAIGGYFLLSILFLHFPTILHKKKKQAFKCKHISHRGGSGECLENTMGAFENAVESGTDMLEIDVQITADGEVVVCHDNNLQRLAGQDILISDTLFEDLPPLLKTLEVTAAPGKTCTCINGDRKIPKLRTVFERYPEVPMNIDIKTGEIDLADKTLELIYEFKRQKGVVMGGFSSKPGNHIRKKYPEINLLCSAPRLALIYVLFYIGLLPFIPLKESFFEIPYMPLLTSLIPWTGFKLLVFKMISWLTVSPVLFRHMKRRGFQVYIFILNEEEHFKICFEKLGVDGIMTDYPKKLRDFISSAGLQQHSETTPINRDNDSS